MERRLIFYPFELGFPAIIWRVMLD